MIQYSLLQNDVIGDEKVRVTVIGFQSPYPGLNQATPGYLIETSGGTKVLVDCGSGVAASIQQWNPITSLDAIVLSHYHHDHVADLGVFQYAFLMEVLAGKRTKPLPVYGPAAPIDLAKIRTYNDVTEGIDISDGDEMQIGELRFRFFQTDHDGPCYGMSITDGGTTIVYGADSSPYTDWSKIDPKPDLLILESTYLEENKNPSIKHLSAKDAALIADRFEAKKLLLTHLYPTIAKEEYLREASVYFNGDIFLPYMGLQLEIESNK